MDVVRHAVNGNQLVSVVPNNPGDVFVNLFFVPAANQRQTAAHCEDSLNVNLCVSICHEIYISLLTELSELMRNGGYKRLAPTGLMRRSFYTLTTAKPASKAAINSSIVSFVELSMTPVRMTLP